MNIPFGALFRKDKREDQIPRSGKIGARDVFALIWKPAEE